MAVQAMTFLKKSMNEPDEVRIVPKGRIEVVKLGDHTLMRATFEPGWRWSEHVKPKVGTQLCETAHLGYVVTGRLGTRMKDGAEMVFGPGECALIPPGHDGWVEGDQPVVFLDFTAGEHYAR